MSYSTRMKSRRLESAALRGFSPEFRDALYQSGATLTVLRPLGTRPPLAEYFRSLWERRYFIYVGARGEASAKHSRDRLGPAWLVLKPLLDAAFYFVIFGVILQIGRGMDNYVAFVLVGVFMFQLSSRAMTAGASLIKNSKAMIRAFAFPRASLAFSYLARDALLSAPSIAIMLLLIAVLPPFAPPQNPWMLFPVLLLVQLVFNLGLVLLLARVGHLFPDVTQIVTFFVRILTYASGVIFPIERFLSHEQLVAWIQANPFYVLLDMYRQLLINGIVPDASQWLYILAWAFGTLIVGFVLFWWAERSYGRE